MTSLNVLGCSTGRSAGFTPRRTFATILARHGRPSYKYFPGSGGPTPPAGAGCGVLRFPVLLSCFAFLRPLLEEALERASVGAGWVVPCATLMLGLEVTGRAFCVCIAVVIAKIPAPITDPRMRVDILVLAGRPHLNCHNNPGRGVFISGISCLLRIDVHWGHLRKCAAHLALTFEMMFRSGICRPTILQEYQCPIAFVAGRPHIYRIHLSHEDSVIVRLLLSDSIKRAHERKSYLRGD